MNAKGIVMKTDKRHTVILCKDGSFMRIKSGPGHVPGHEVEIREFSSRSPHTWLKTASIAAVFFLTISLGAGAYCYTRPYSYVSVDINPSIEITTNVFDRIIRTEGLNEDGTRLLSKIGCSNLNIRDGVEKILNEAILEGYMDQQNEGSIVLAVAGKNETRADKLKDSVLQAAGKALKQNSVESDVMAEKVALQRHDTAKSIGVSSGKVVLLEKLKEYEPEVKLEELKQVPVKDIVKKIKEDKEKDRSSENQADGEEKQNGQQTSSDKENRDSTPGAEKDVTAGGRGNGNDTGAASGQSGNSGDKKKDEDSGKVKSEERQGLTQKSDNSKSGTKDGIKQNNGSSSDKANKKEGKENQTSTGKGFAAGREIAGAKWGYRNKRD